MRIVKKAMRRDWVINNRVGQVGNVWEDFDKMGDGEERTVESRSPSNAHDRGGFALTAGLLTGRLSLAGFTAGDGLVVGGVFAFGAVADAGAATFGAGAAGGSISEGSSEAVGGTRIAVPTNKLSGAFD